MPVMAAVKSTGEPERATATVSLGEKQQRLAGRCPAPCYLRYNTAGEAQLVYII